MLKIKALKIIAKVLGGVAFAVMAFTMIISYVPQVEGWLVDIFHTSIENIRMFTTSGSIGIGVLGAYFSFSKSYAIELQGMDKTLASAIEKNVANKDEYIEAFDKRAEGLKKDVAQMFANERETMKHERQVYIDEINDLKKLLVGVLKSNESTFLDGSAERLQAELDKGE